MVNKLQQAFVTIRRNQSILLSQADIAKQPTILLINTPVKQKQDNGKLHMLTKATNMYVLLL
jgi:hypothetical protein